MASPTGTDATAVIVGSRVTVVRAALGRGGTTWMIGGSLLAGLGAYLFQVVGARALGEVDYAPIGVLWTVQYLLSSVLMTALESWVVRTTTSAGGSVHSLRAVAPRLVGAVLVVAGVAGAGAYVGREALLPGHTGLVLVVPLLVLVYSAFVSVRGVLAARERYKAYGGVTAAESLARLGAAIVVALTVPSPVLLALCLPLGALTGAVWGLLSRLRRPAEASRDRPDATVAVGEPTVDRPAALPGGAVPVAVGPARFLAVTSGANAAAQVLLAAGPLVLGPLGATPREVSVLFVTLTAARVPLVIVQGGLLSRLLPTFTRLAADGETRALTRTGTRLVATTAGAAVVAAAVGWLIGPAVIAAMFGSGFRPGAAVTAAVACGVVTGTGALMVNQVLIAAGREQALLLPWWSGLAAAAVVIAVTSGLPPVDRVLLGLVLGVLTALALLLAALLRTRRRTT